MLRTLQFAAKCLGMKISFRFLMKFMKAQRENKRMLQVVSGLRRLDQNLAAGFVDGTFGVQSWNRPSSSLTINLNKKKV